jgi:hypothetical protein
MSSGGFTACVALAAALAASPDLAHAQSAPNVVSGHPVVPLVLGGMVADVAFEVDAPAARVLLSVDGASATAGTFAALSGVAVERDDASAVPFHVRIPLNAPFPRDGVLTLSARAVGTGGAVGAEARFQFDASARPVRFADAPVRVGVDGTGAITVEVRHEGPVCETHVSLTGASARSFRAVNGNLSDVEGTAFASASLLVAYPTVGAPERSSFVVPTEGELPFDGVVIVDVAIRDAFGRVSHTSAVEFTDRGAVDTVLGIRAEPSPILLALGAGQRERLVPRRLN